MITTRIERSEDIPHVCIINEQAFNQSAEANIVDKLRQNCPDYISLVAEKDKRLVGHIFFSPVVVECAGHRVEGMGLAPMALLPDHQRQGVGSALVKRGFEILREQSCPFVIVLGHPKYYPRFGFELVSKYNLKSQWDGVPDEAFMIVVFDRDSLQNVSGVARYRDEFNEAM